MAVPVWTGRETKLLRQALRMSVRVFAEHLGVSVRTVAKWESAGSERRPQPEMQSALDTVRERMTEEQRRRFEVAVKDVVSDDTREDATDRRQFLTGLAASGFALSADVALPRVGVEHLRHIAQAVDGASLCSERDLVPYFTERLQACAGADGAHGPREALPIALGVIAALEHVAGQVTAAARRPMLSVAARGAELAGWLYRDLGEPIAAAYWRDRAMEWAQEAGDLPLQGYVLLRKSQAAWDARDGARMLTLAQAVQGGPWPLSAAVRAEAAQQEARGHAMTGGSIRLVEGKLDAARELLTAGAPAEPSPAEVATWRYQQALLSVQVGMCWAEAGLHDRALVGYQEGLTDAPFSVRDIAYFSALRASSLASVGDSESAARTGLASYKVAVETTSRRTVSEVQRLLTQLRPVRQRPAVRRLAEAVTFA